MAVATPDWLTQRGCALEKTNAGPGWIVLLGRQPQYRLLVRPAGGRFSCEVTETNNGKRLDRGGVAASADEALAAGLEDLRQALGW